MQSESCIWDIETVCNFVLSQEEQTTETEKRDMERGEEESFLFLFLLYFIILQGTSVVDSTVSSSRLRTASVTMVS